MSDLINNIYFQLNLFLDPAETGIEKLKKLVEEVAAQAKKEHIAIAAVGRDFLELCEQRDLLSKKKDELREIARSHGMSSTQWEDMWSFIQDKPLGFFHADSVEAVFQDLIERMKRNDEAFKNLNIQQQAKEATSARMEELNILVIRDCSNLTQKRYEDTCNTYKNYFKVDTIKKQYNAKNISIFTFTPPEPTSLKDGREVSSSDMDKLENDLSVVGKKDLYHFLSSYGGSRDDVRRGCPVESVEIGCAQLAEYLKDRKQTDPVISAALRLLGQVKKYLCDKAYRNGYDAALDRRRFDKSVLPLLRGKDRINAEEYHSAIEQAESVGCNLSVARWLVYDFLHKKIKDKDFPLIQPGQIKETLRCPECHEPNDINAKVCKKCKFELKVKCPGKSGPCEIECYTGDGACSQCGFPITEILDLDRMVEQGLQAVQNGKKDEARDLWLNINTKWRKINTSGRKHPKAEKLDDAIKKWEKEYEDLRKQAGEIENKIRIALGKRFIYEAKRLFDDLHRSFGAAISVKDEEKRIVDTFAEVQRDLSQLKMLSADAAIDLCEEILAKSADCEEARLRLERELRDNPPKPPTNLNVIEVPTGFELQWHLPASGKINVFVVVRKIGAIPASPSDGNKVAEGITGTNFTDSNLDIGTIYGYAVFTQRGNITETTGSKAKQLVQKIGEIQRVKVTPGNQTLTVEWENQKGTTGIKVVRYDGNATTGSATSVTLQHSTSFIDNNLKNGQYYTYCILSVFKGIDSKPRISDGKIVRGKPQKPPQAVVDLSAQESGERVALHWTVPTNGEVLLFDCPQDPTVQAGVAEYTTPAVLQTRFGNSIPVINAAAGQTEWKNASVGVRYILPVTFHDGLAVFGKYAAITRIDDVKNLKVQDTGTRLYLTWDWGTGLQKVLVCCGQNGFAENVYDTRVQQKLLTRQEYDVEKAFVVQRKSGTANYYFTVYAAVEYKSKIIYSNGVRIQTGRTAIKYDVILRRSFLFLGKVSAKIVLTLESKQGRMPDIAVVQNYGSLPLTRERGETILEIPAAVCRRQAVDVPEDYIREKSYIRLFVKNADEADAYTLDQPERERLLLVWRLPKFYEFLAYILSFFKR